MNKFKHNTGIMFPNDKRTMENNQPHFRGRLNFDDKPDMYISAWENKSPDGDMRYSLKMEPIDAAKSGAPLSRKDDWSAGAAPADKTDDIPF